jgi:hypothetical protein
LFLKGEGKRTINTGKLWLCERIKSIKNTRKQQKLSDISGSLGGEYEF